MYRMNQKIIVPETWMDKTYTCFGWIVGIEKIQDKNYLGTFGIEEYKRRFMTRVQYKVIFQHNDKVYEKWYLDKEIDVSNAK